MAAEGSAGSLLLSPWLLSLLGKLVGRGEDLVAVPAPVAALEAEAEAAPDPGAPPPSATDAATAAPEGQAPRPAVSPGQSQTWAETAGQPSQPADGHEHAFEWCQALPQDLSLMESLGLNDTGSVRLSAPLASLDQTFLLNSNPWASTTIYLDFDGHTTTGTAWNNSTMGSSFSSPAFSLDTDRSSFSSSELTRIQQVWQRVSADFSCFDVNVTTQAPPVDWLIKNNSTDPFYGVRVVITNYGPSSGSAGGIAYINSFSWDSDTPAFVYNTSLLGVSEAISHEVGHTLGLSHDGSFDGTTTVGYYQGHGSGENGWAPIMGVGYYKSVTTWDNGIYYISNNGGSTANYNKGADDLAILSSNLGVAPQQDQEGNSPQTATPLILTAGTASQYGTIQTAADTDWYQFQLLNAGDLNLQFNPYVYSSYIDDDGTWGGSFTPYFSSVSDAVANTSWADNGTNLDLSVDLLNNEGTVVASSNPAGLAASLTLSGLPAGLYYLRLDGTGYGDPTQSSPTGYSDYASIGSYLISGTITNSEPLPVVSLAGEWLQVQEDGDSNLVFTFSRSDAGVDPLTVSFSIAGSASAGSDYASLPSSITFAPGALTASLIVDPIADSSVEADETVSLSLLPGSGYLLASALPVTGTIANDDLPSVSLSLSPASVAEDGTSNLLFSFSRSDAGVDPLTVSFSIAGSASAGSDYASLPSSITFAPGALTASLIVDPIADSSVEADETVSLSLLPGSGYLLGSSLPVTGTIANDDLPSVSLSLSPASVAEDGTSNLLFSFSRSDAGVDPLTVSFSIAGSASAGSDYASLPSSITFAPGALTASLIVDPIADSSVEADETVSLSLLPGSGYLLSSALPVTGTITNDDLPSVSLSLSPASVAEDGTSNLLFSFSRSDAGVGPLTVSFSIAGSATAGSDYASLPSSITFAPGALTASLIVDPIADSSVEADETVSLSLLPGSGYLLGSSLPVTGTIANDDLPSVSLSLSPASVAEDGTANLLFSFSRSDAGVDPLTVSFSIAGSASAGSDYASIPSSITFAPGALTASLIVDPIADSSVEADETVSLSLLPGSGYLLSSALPVTGTITNDDLPPKLLFTAGIDTLTGTSSSDTFQLRNLKDALLGSGTPDRILGLQAGVDRIDTPLPRTTAIAPRQLGAVTALTSTAIASVLTTRQFPKDGAATFTFGSGSSTRTFLALNDASSGFVASNDAVIEITGYSGSLGALAIL